MRVPTTNVCSFQEDRWQNIHFESKPRHVTPQMNRLGKMSPVLKSSNTHVCNFQEGRWENINF